MDKHYILNLNPQADSEWDRCVLRNPLSGERPDLSTEIAKAVSDRASYSTALCEAVSFRATEETSATASLSDGSRGEPPRPPRFAFRAGSYLIKVKLEVEILEQITNPSNRLELPVGKKSTVLKKERLAS